MNLASEGTKHFAHELDDLRQRWRIRREELAELEGKEPDKGDYDYTVILTGEDLRESYNQIVKECELLEAKLSRAKPRHRIPDHLFAKLQASREVIIAELAYKRAIGRALREKMKSERRIDPAALAGNEPVLAALRLFRQLSEEISPGVKRVQYSEEEWLVIDTLWKWLILQGEQK